MSHLMSAQLGFCIPGHLGTPENRRNQPREFWRVLPATWPIALRDGITEWAQFLFQGGGRPELRGRRGTFWWFRRGVVFLYAVGVRCSRCCRALPGPCQRSVDFQVYVFTPDPSGGGGEMAMVVPCCRPWHSASCAPCCSDSLSRQVASSVSSLSVVILVSASTR